MRKSNRPPLWRQTPPAVFPVALGFTGLGMAWRGATGVLPVPAAIGDLLIGMALSFYLYFLVTYSAKLISRPGVLLEDMKTPAGRAGIAAFAMVLMLFSLVLHQDGLTWGGYLWLGAIVLHSLAALLAIESLLKSRPEARLVSPFQFLTFVGLIVAPVAGVQLGFPRLSLWISWYSLVPFAIITVLVVKRLIFARPVPPLRPPLVILLAPVGLFAIAFGQLGMIALFDIFFAAAVVLALVYLVYARWLCEGGFGPTWGSFTFPAAVFTNMCILAAKTGLVPYAWVGVIAGLAVATPLILYIVYKAVMAFVKGELSKKSGAATA